MDPTARLEELLASPCGVPPLDEAALLVAAHDHPVDVRGALAQLDELAARCAEPSVDAVVSLLFEDEGFVGDEEDYYHPDNSFLDRVLERRRGLPILLALIAAEVGARAGVCLAPVGMPGHFLLRDCADPDGYLDPFHRGRRLDREGCAAIFRALHPGMPFVESYLDPIDARTVLLRLVTNLVRSYTTRGPVTSLAWSLHLRALVAGSPDSWVPVARIRERIGDWAGAADAWAEVGTDQAVARADAVRARVN
jgi:regulator of sirC expression with transglutaminase-like and TPR domain